MNVLPVYMEMELIVKVTQPPISLLCNYFLEHGTIIATNHPYGADEEWESTFICEKNQFVKLKFDSMEITDIANDILKIQLMTSELSTLYLLKVSNFNVLN